MISLTNTDSSALDIYMRSLLHSLRCLSRDASGHAVQQLSLLQALSNPAEMQCPTKELT